ncbi:MAG TPA: glycosyltransferase family 39 protein [Gemmataceae bacterium]|jgi:hypothetical protein
MSDTPSFATSRGRRLDLLVLAAAAAGCLLPFAAKPLHIDDPLFIWAARRVHEHPLDPYGYIVNWDHFDQPMWQVTQNPPVAVYYAAAAGLIGWGEVTLHLAFWLPAVGVLWGTYRLAQQFGAPPLLSALASLTAPVFFVSATTVMSDVLMLCGWLWALVWWDRGLREGRLGPLYGAGVLALAAVLTKYFAITLLPLMAVYALALAPRGWLRWLPPLAVAAGGVVAYRFGTQALYGQDLLGKAVEFTKGYEHAVFWSGASWRGTSALTFLGAGAGGLALLLPRPVLRRWLPFVALAALAGAFAVWDSGVPWWFRAQLLGWAAVGGGLVLIAVGELYRRRDPESLLLALWITGTYAFTAFVNHSVNARSILPAMPALAILVLRLPGRDRGLTGGPAWALIPAAALALAVGWADLRTAEADRTAAQWASGFAPPGRTLWFHGHWGWQYYLAQMGGRAWDETASRAVPGDVIAIAYNDYALPRPADDRVRTAAELDVAPCPWLATMSPSVGAGFYSFYWGALPYAFGPVAPERFEIVQVTQPFGRHKHVPVASGSP